MPNIYALKYDKTSFWEVECPITLDEAEALLKELMVSSAILKSRNKTQAADLLDISRNRLTKILDDNYSHNDINVMEGHVEMCKERFLDIANFIFGEGVFILSETVQNPQVDQQYLFEVSKKERFVGTYLGELPGYWTAFHIDGEEEPHLVKLEELCILPHDA